jgi:tRNA (guanine37-N1)-methyltransferase
VSLKQALQGKLSKKELEKLRASFDIVGDIAIIEIAKGLAKKEKIIANELLKTNSSIKTVAKKVGGHIGKYRVQPLKIIAGPKKTEAEVRESGVRMLVDVAKCYFSPRLGHERLRIAKQIKKGEEVLVMFSGVAPYQLVFAKHSPAKIIYGVELNPVAHKYALKNVLLNNFGNKIVLFKGDAKKIVPQLAKSGKKFDRIVMPLPKSGENFLSAALKAAKKGATIHFYSFLPEGKFSEAEEKITKACSSSKRKCKILRIVKAGQQGPRMWRICADFRVL